MGDSLLPREIARARVGDETFSIRTHTKTNIHSRFEVVVYQKTDAGMEEISRFNGKNDRGWRSDSTLLSDALDDIAFHEQVSESDINVSQARGYGEKT